MRSHLDVEILNGDKFKPLVLPDDFSLSMEEKSPIFGDVEMYSLQCQIPLDGNRSLWKNIDYAQSDVRPIDFEHRKVRIIADGMPFRSGVCTISPGEQIKESLTFNIDAAEQSFDDLIGDLECQDVPIKDKIQIGEKIGNVKVSVQYQYRVKVGYREKKDEDSEIQYTSADQVEGTFEPQALGFSYPGICEVEDEDTQVAVAGAERVYPEGKTVKTPKNVLQSFINVSDAYPDKPYCNARIAYLHHGLNEDGTTSSGLVDMEKVNGQMEDKYPYWVLDADRPQSGLCFYVLYFLECLFTHLGVDYDLSALTGIEDFKHLCFFTTRHKYYTELAHADRKTPFFESSTNTRYRSKPSDGIFPSIPSWRILSEERFNQELFGDINNWLNSRGCGGQLAIPYPSPKQVQDFMYKKNDEDWEKVVVGKNGVDSISIEATIINASVSANILSMYASSENFPDASVKSVLDSLKNSFGIKFYYDYEQRKVTAYLIRDVFRSNNKPISFHGEILSLTKIVDKTTGVRMAYSAESDSKEQRQNIKKGIKNYDTDYDYIDYPAPPKTRTDLTYSEITQTNPEENLITYIDRTTGNTYRWKADQESLESGEYKCSLFQVATFKGVEIGDCSPQNEDNIVEFISDFIPVPFSDVNYKIAELSIRQENAIEYRDHDNVYSVKKINSELGPIMSAYLNIDMEHEFVAQYINNGLPSPYVNLYLTERLELIESYDPTKTDDGNSPLQHYDWGLSIAIMQGGGTNSTMQTYDYNYDGMGNHRWRTVPGKYAMTSDSLDMYGQPYDYNGDREGIGGGERFSLKIRSWQAPEWSKDAAGNPLPIINEDETDSSGHVIKKIRTRGLYDSFMAEYGRLLTEGKLFQVEVLASVAQLNDIKNHWMDRFDINGLIGWIKKVEYDISKNNGIENAVLEFIVL